MKGKPDTNCLINNFPATKGLPLVNGRIERNGIQRRINQPAGADAQLKIDPELFDLIFYPI